MVSWNNEDTCLVAERCADCKCLYVYDMTRQMHIHTYQGVIIYSLLEKCGIIRAAVSKNLDFVTLRWNETKNCLEKINEIIEGETILKHSKTTSCIYVYRLDSKSLVWQVDARNLRVDGKLLSRGLSECCSDNNGRIYTHDTRNNRLLVLDAGSGQIVQVIEMANSGYVCDIKWMASRSSLILYTGRDTVVEYQVSMLCIVEY